MRHGAAGGTGTVPLWIVTSHAALLLSVCVAGCNPAAQAPIEPGPDGDEVSDAGGAASGHGGAGARNGGISSGSGGASADGAAGDSEGAAGTGGAPTPPIEPPRGDIVFSEIMYHPVAENAMVDAHEFIELYNRGDVATSLAGWRLTGGVQYTFPAGSSIEGKAFLVVAKDPQKLLSVARWALKPAQVVGGYQGELDNGGTTIALVDAMGAPIDTLKYDDKFPWPHAADGFGASEKFLAADHLPLEKHQYMGHSIERVSYEVPTQDVANWVPSPIDAATPGRANSVGGAPPTMVLEQSAAPEGGDATKLVGATDKVHVVVRFGGAAPMGPELEWFVDDLAKTDEAHLRTPLVRAGDVWEAVLPSRPNNSIVRYRVNVSDKGVVSPRPSDPYGWFAYFVGPVVSTKSRLYHIFISPANWGRMWTDIQGGNHKGACDLNPGYHDMVPAVFVYGGVVHDVLTRYQGSHYNRDVGLDMNGKFTGTSPQGGPSPLKALSWKITFPAYAQFEGRKNVLLNKMRHACPGDQIGVGSRVFADLGIPSQRRWFARVHVNGGYYHYMLDYERVDDDLLKRVQAKGTSIGDLFKCVGEDTTAGPIGFGDGRILTADNACKLSALQRYSNTYPRKNYDWKGPSAEVQQLIEDMDRARTGGKQALRDFFTTNFDIDQLIKYRAAIGWMVGGDELIHNYYLYRRADGKWTTIYYDYDFYFRMEFDKPTTSLYWGTAAEIQPATGWWSRWRDNFFIAFKAEYEKAVLDIAKTTGATDKMAALVDETMAGFDANEARSAPAGLACDPAKNLASAKQWIKERNAYLMQTIKP